MKNIRIFSLSLVLALVVGILGVVSTTNVLAVGKATSTTIDNVAPAFTVDATDNGSNGTTPTNVGSDVTFTATAVDPNLDDYYLAICETNSASPGDVSETATPTCPGGSWAISSSGVTSGTEATVTYTTLSLDREANTWYAFVCDATQGASLCSSAGSSDTPFNVNHAGDFGSVVNAIASTDYPYATTPDANGVTLTNKTAGPAALGPYLQLGIFNSETVDCAAEVPAAVATLISGSSPSWSISCDFDDSTQGGGANPLTGTRLAAGIENLAGTGINAEMSAAAAGTGNSVMIAFTSARLTTVPSIDPGETVGFVINYLSLTDEDISPTQDTTTVYFCSGESDMGGVTTAFDYSANTCTNGTLLCTSGAVNPTNTAAYCNDTTDSISVPTAHATYDYVVYAEDNHSFPNTGTSAQSFAVADVPPVLDSYTTTDTLNILAGSYDTLTRAVTYHDDNGDRDVTAMDFAFFEDTSETDACVDDNNDCYRADSLDPLTLGSSAPSAGTAGCYTSTVGSAGTGKTATGADENAVITCDWPIYFNATASTNWEVSATVTDGIGAENFADSTVNTTIAALSGIGIAEASISYGTIAVNTDSTFSASTTTTMENLGNQILDVLISGTVMSSGTDTIAAAQQKNEYSGTDFTWASAGDALQTSASSGNEGEDAGCLNRDMAVRAVWNTGTEDEAIGWKIHIPTQQESGTYTGTNTFATNIYTGGSACTGTLR